MSSNAYASEINERGVVTLTAPELRDAAKLGAERHIRALIRKSQDAHGADVDRGWSLHIDGVCGEMAVAKALGVPWENRIDTYQNLMGDVGHGVEVRTRSRTTYDLIVRERDPARPFALVVGVAPTFRVVGWMMGDAAKQPRWAQWYGGRERAYFVPQDELLPIADLPEFWR